MKSNFFISAIRSRYSLAYLGLAALLLTSLFIPALAASGNLDTTFGVASSGINFTDFNTAHNSDRICALALQTDGKIVAAGESNNHFAVARYDSNGLLDTANFGAPNGTVTTAIQTSSVANGVAIQADGKIVVVGSSSDGARNYFTVARYNDNGSLDTAGFNAPTGYIISTLSTGNDVATTVVLQNDGKIVVGGYTDSQFIVARYNINGTLDTTTFNAPNGFRTITIGTKDEAQAIGLQSDGKIILAGHADTGTSDDFAVARFTTSGALDTTFNSGTGYITTDFPSQQIDLAQALTIQPDDKIVVAGYTKSGTINDFALARYSAQGTLDTTFGTNGRVRTSISGNDQAHAVAIQSTGRIVVAGMSVDPVDTEDFAIALYTSAGVLDTTLDGLGYKTVNTGDILASGAVTADFLEAALIQSDNKIVVGGYTDHPRAFGDDNFAIARFDSPNMPPTVSNFSKSGSEDGSISFAEADFTTHFSDADGDSLAKVQVVALPANGALKLSGNDVAAGQEISASSLANLTYQPNANYNGSDSFDWSGSDGLDYATTGASVTINLSPVNDTPVNNVPGAFNVNEDASQSNLVFSISDVDAGSAANFQFTLSAFHGSLSLASTTGLSLIAGSNGSPSMTYQGSLAESNAALGAVNYSPDANYNGSDTITLNANDNGNTGAGGALQDTDPVSVTVDPVNDAPSFTKGADINLQENDPPQALTGWATALSAGPANESGQSLHFEVVSNTNPGLFSAGPAVDANGALSFTLAFNAYGNATIGLVIKDDGGVANGGVDTSAPQTFAVNVAQIYQVYLPLLHR